jgi:hypothetical protein
MDFFKLSKVLKIYPTIVKLETLKKVVMKSPEYWKESNQDIHALKMGPTPQDGNFNFEDFVHAF